MERLDKKIIINKRLPDKVKIKGIPQDQWDFYYDCKCRMLDLIGREKYDAYNVKLENTIKFKCRSSSELKNIVFHKKDYQIVWDDIIFNIIFIDTLGGSKDWIILQGQATI